VKGGEVLGLGCNVLEVRWLAVDSVLDAGGRW
jgi:hypothetical protein